MNILKHMEAVFIAVVLIAVPASYLGAAHAGRSDAPRAIAGAVAGAGANVYAGAVATSGKVAVVTITAKRLDRAQLLAAR